MNNKNRAWAEVSLDAIKNNIKNIRQYVNPSARILGVVKADAYGHGCLEVARTLLENGADALAVACTDEAVQLRLCKIACPILILGYTNPDDAETLLKYDITPACFDLSFAKAMSNAGAKLKKTAKIHIKTDTGMGRIGYLYGDDPEINQKTISDILEISALPNIEIEGIFTHFSVADADDDAYTYMQFDRFLSLCDALKLRGLSIPLRHCCNSAALIRFPHMHLDMVRPGIILYGQRPSSFVDTNCLNLMPTMTFKAKISNIKTM
ncbi:MAG: alanine racemase, partial [Clostridia bacterium]|nr:alanine racemase [Clostridia bacterium]